MKTLILVFLLTLIPACSPAFSRDIDLDTIATIESSNNPLAYNQKSEARGLYQITPICLKEYNNYHIGRMYMVQDLFNPAINKHIAIWYLSERIPQMLRHFKKEVTIRNILISYNAGINYVVKDLPLPKETVDYIDKYNWYKESN